MCQSQAVLDLSFVRQRGAHPPALGQYGRPSFKTELVMRMLLLEYLDNLSGD